MIIAAHAKLPDVSNPGPECTDVHSGTHDG